MKGETIMYVYIQSEKGGFYGDEILPPLYTVGHYDPSGKWISESDHTTPEAAAARVHYLNGGTRELADKAHQ